MSPTQSPNQNGNGLHHRKADDDEILANPTSSSLSLDHDSDASTSTSGGIGNGKSTSALAALLGLRYIDDWRTIVWVMIYFASSAYFWQNFYSFSYLAATGLFFFCAAFSFFTATITHNVVHVPIFKDSHTLNNLFQIALSLSYGWPVSALIPGHNLSHHRYTQTKKDSMLTTRLRYKTHLLNYLMFPIVVTKTIARHDAEYMDEQRRLGRPIWHQYLRELVIFVLFQIVFCFVDWKRYVIVWLLPQLYAKFQIISINQLQHDGCEAPHPTKNKYNHSRNFVGGVINFFTFNNGFHCIHHLKPGLHWTYLPEAHKREVEPFNHPNLNQDNIFSYFFETFIYPGERKWFDGTPYKRALLESAPEDDESEAWYDGTAETYSNPITPDVRDSAVASPLKAEK